jgi:hypothetical protein
MLSEMGSPTEKMWKSCICELLRAIVCNEKASWLVLENVPKRMPRASIVKERRLFLQGRGVQQ